MNDNTETLMAILGAKPGQIIPLVKSLELNTDDFLPNTKNGSAPDPVAFFSRLTNYGRKQNCCLFESREYLAGSHPLSFGTADPALYLTGTGADFTIKAISNVGRRIIKFLSANTDKHFSFCQKIETTDKTIIGTIKTATETVDEGSRLQSTNQMDVFRAVSSAFKLASKPFRVTCGLFGAISYDFIDQFEKLPESKGDILENPDYELFFADNIFIVDHEHNNCHVVVNVLITDDNRQKIIEEAQQTFEHYDEMVNAQPDPPRKKTDNLPQPGSDTDQAEYESIVKTAKKHIIDGDIFQVVLSRTITEPAPDEPLDIYKRLRALNPSPYMFYLNTPNTILMGSSPELNLRVSGTDTRTVEIRPIAGTKPRGKIDGKIDPDTDSRYEAELKLDRKELAEHMMLVDLARNDIARVAQPGSRIVTELLIAEKYASVQHLVSNVKGKLRIDLDALSAYLATMNMGTLTGAPKIEAMKLIRQLEKTKRGYYGGAVMYLTVDGQFDSCITIRSLQIKGSAAYIRAGAGIVHDSIPKSEFIETEHKANSCRRAIRGDYD